jgi:hypothetical protein
MVDTQGIVDQFKFDIISQIVFKYSNKMINMSLTKRIALFSHCHLRIGVRPLERTNDAKSRMTKYGSMSRNKKK